MTQYTPNLTCARFLPASIFRYDVTRGLRAAAAPLLGPPIRLCSVRFWMRHSFRGAQRELTIQVEECQNVSVGTSLALHPKDNIHGGEYGQFPRNLNAYILNGTQKFSFD